MSQSFAVRLCRVVAPEKLPDRFLASGVLYQKENPLLAEQVILVYIFEVTKPWFPSSKVLPTLLGTLQEQHAALSPSQELGDQFELLLRTVNERLNALSEAGETDWIGNLNGLIMAISQEELHFSQTGRCPAYILQNNRIRQITDDSNQEREPHPMKTFSNLASGSLHENDQILLANHELYREISLDALRRIMNTSSPYQASLAISKELKRVKNPAISSAIVKIVPDSAAATEQAEPAEVILEEEMQSAARKFQKRLVPLVEIAKKFSKKAGSEGLKAAGQAKTVIATTVAPKAGELLQKSAAKASALKDQVAKKSSAEIPQETPSAAAEASPADSVPEQPAETSSEEPVVEVILSQKEREQKKHEKIAEAAVARAEKKYAVESEAEEEEEEESIIPATELSLDSSAPIGLMSIEPREGEEEEGEEPAAKSPKAKKLQSAFSTLKQRFTVWIDKPKNKKIAALAVAALLLTLTVTGAFAKKTPQDTAATESENAKILTAVEEMTKKIGSAIELKQEIEASRDIEEAQKQLGLIKDPTDQQKEKLGSLWASLTASSDSLTKTTRLTTAAETYTFPAASNGLIGALPYFYGFSTGSEGLLRTGKGDSNETQKSLALPSSSDTVAALAKSSESGAAGYVLTRQNKVYRLVPDGVSVSLKALSPASGEFATGDDITSYAGHLYILDGKTGLVWRYSNTGSGYAKGVSLLDINKYDISKSASFAIDGSIYILKQDGTVMKFTSGQQDKAFTLREMPYLAQKMVQPLQIITDDTMHSIYILDAGITTLDHSTARVIEFDKNGVFLGQYGFPASFTKVKAFDINPKEKKIWVLNGSEVSEFSL